MEVVCFARFLCRELVNVHRISCDCVVCRALLCPFLVPLLGFCVCISDVPCGLCGKKLSTDHFLEKMMHGTLSTDHFLEEMMCGTLSTDRFLEKMMRGTLSTDRFLEEMMRGTLSTSHFLKKMMRGTVIRAAFYN